MKQDKQTLASVCAGVAVVGLALTSWAGAPPGRYTVSTDTVLDTVTTLTWQRNAPATTYSWANAGAYCASLNLSGTGWRLPTVKELQSLVDISAYGPAIDTVAFPSTFSSTPSTYCWSSSPSAYSSWDAWVVYVSSGATDFSSMTNTGHVRCVR
jgi:hypothetical protein